MVKQLAELHGGTVAVASAVGEGARFAAWLPLRTQVRRVPTPRADGSGASAAAGMRYEGRVALVVEDDDRAADLVRLLLEAEGFSVVRSATAEDALELAPEQELSLITLDVQLPGIDGWEFLRRIRETESFAQVPVVIIAGVIDSSLALAGGASAILQKPISRTQLQDSLAALGLDVLHDRPRTVLVVDDDPTAVEVIAAFLPSPGHAVVRAYGGTEAIVLARRLHPDLILLDLTMPEVSGFDVVDALKRSSDTARIPIIIVTAKAITEEDRVSLNSEPGGVVCIVDKAGFHRHGFLAEVRRALPQR